MKRSGLFARMLARFAPLGCVPDSTARALDFDARVVGVRSTGESAPVALVTMIFRNRSADAIEIRSYRVRWPDGNFTAEVRDLRIAPGEEVERTARLDSRTGHIATLLLRPDDVTVEASGRMCR